MQSPSIVPHLLTARSWSHPPEWPSATILRSPSSPPRLGTSGDLMEEVRGWTTMQDDNLAQCQRWDQQETNGRSPTPTLPTSPSLTLMRT